MVRAVKAVAVRQRCERKRARLCQELLAAGQHGHPLNMGLGRALMASPRSFLVYLPHAPTQSLREAHKL